MIKTGLNKVLLEYGREVTCIYGPAASGKTTLALMACVEAAKEGKKVLFIDTEEGFSVDRFKQISGDVYLLKNIIILNFLRDLCGYL